MNSFKLTGDWTNSLFRNGFFCFFSFAIIPDTLGKLTSSNRFIIPSLNNWRYYKYGGQDKSAEAGQSERFVHVIRDYIIKTAVGIIDTDGC